MGRKLKERKEEEERAREKEEAAPRKERHEHESEIRGKEDESQTVAETQCASEKPTLPAASASSWGKEMEQLQVTIHGAKNLPKKGMLGQCNPYVVLIVEDQRIRSAAIRKSFNPGWNFTTVLDIEPDASQQLEICVFDETIDGDDLIGETCLGVDDIIMTLKVKEIKEAWLDMDYCNNAQIMISTEMVAKKSTEDLSCPTAMDKTTTKADEEASARQLEEEEKAKQKAREDAETARKAIEAEEEKKRAKAEAERKAKEEAEAQARAKEEAQKRAKEEEEEKKR